MGSRRLILAVLGVAALAYGALAGLVWLVNTTRSRSEFVGQVAVGAFPILVEGPALPWIAAISLTSGLLAVWRARAD